MKTTLIIYILLLFSLTSSAQKVLNAVHFGFDVHELTTQNKKTLDELIPQLNETEIILKGYTDFIGSSSYNDKLSNQRVSAVKNYLLGKGIKETSIKQSVGLGELTEFKDRAKNRRVNIFISKKPQVVVEEIKKERVEITTKEAVEVIEKTKFLSVEKIESLEVGESIALENMEFIPGKHYLQKYSKPTLVELLEIMQNKPNLKVEIQGHICCDHSGDDGLDWDTQTRNLSLNRAKHIYEYLVSEGISEDRLSYKGFGSSKPLVKEVTEADQQRNRRVELMIVEK
jgi:outer membrane protein OmpA-like peptidoglycan-associated protein